MQTKREHREAFFEIVQETLRITPMLEPDDLVNGVAHDDSIAVCLGVAPSLDPQVVHVVQVDVGKDW